MKIVAAIFILGLIVWTTEAVVPVDKLVLYLPFEEGKGVSVNDVSGSGNDGEIVGGAAWSQEGKYGEALEFNSKDSYVLIPTSPSLEIATEVTIMAWIKWVDAGDNWLCIMASGTQNGPWENYGMFIRRGDKALYFPINLKGGFVLAGGCNTTPGGVIKPAEWQHVCGTYDGDTARVYVDGKLVHECQHGDALEPTLLDLRIGHRLGSNHYFSGLMDEVAVFEYALDEDEIATAMSGLDAFLAVLEPVGKLSTCWGAIKE